MKYMASAVVLGLLLSLSACVPSLHELYTEKDVIFEPALLGEWVEAKPQSESAPTLTFIKTADKEYELVSAGEKERLSYVAHLVKLGDKVFLDVKDAPSVDCHTLAVPIHMFFLVSQTEPTLRMWDFNDKWLEKFLEKNPAALNHESVDRDMILTASTKELQRFVLRHLNTKDAFTDPIDYVRKK